MQVNYDRLWKLMIDKKINKTQLSEKAGITTNAMAKLGKNESVQVEILAKICNVLDCNIEDIMELYNGHLDIVNDFFQKDINRGRKYIFFASIAEKDINAFVQLCLKDNEFYQALFTEADWFFSSFSQLDYDTYCILSLTCNLVHLSSLSL